jgi:hypothetical protein
MRVYVANRGGAGDNAHTSRRGLVNFGTTIQESWTLSLADQRQRTGARITATAHATARDRPPAAHTPATPRNGPPPATRTRGAAPAGAPPQTDARRVGAAFGPAPRTPARPRTRPAPGPRIYGPPSRHAGPQRGPSTRNPPPHRGPHRGPLRGPQSMAAFYIEGDAHGRWSRQLVIITLPHSGQPRPVIARRKSDQAGVRSSSRAYRYIRGGARSSSRCVGLAGSVRPRF